MRGWCVRVCCARKREKKGESEGNNRYSTSSKRGLIHVFSFSAGALTTPATKQAAYDDDTVVFAGEAQCGFPI